MKEVLFVTHVGQPGGAELMMLELCNAYKKKCGALILEHGRIEDLFKQYNIDYMCVPISEKIIKFRRNDGIKNLLYNLPEIFKSFKKIRDQLKRTELIVCFSQKSLALCGISNFFKRKPLIWFMNDYVSTEHFSNLNVFLITRLFSLLADKIIFNSNASLEAWRKSGGKTNKCQVIYPGTNFKKISDDLKNEERINYYRNKIFQSSNPTIGIFGRISEWKGQDVFIDAIEKIDDVYGVIVGGAFFNGEAYEESLKNKVIEKNLSKKIKFIGHVDDPTCAMAACDLIIHASKAPEPFGLVVVEATFIGIPVIATSGGGINEIILDRRTGLLTRMGNAEELRDAILFFLKNRDLAKVMAKNAKERALELFSSNKMISDFDEVVKSVVKK